MLLCGRLSPLTAHSPWNHWQWWNCHFLDPTSNFSYCLSLNTILNTSLKKCTVNNFCLHPLINKALVWYFILSKIVWMFLYVRHSLKNPSFLIFDLSTNSPYSVPAIVNIVPNDKIPLEQKTTEYLVLENNYKSMFSN